MMWLKKPGSITKSILRRLGNVPTFLSGILTIIYKIIRDNYHGQESGQPGKHKRTNDRGVNRRDS